MSWERRKRKENLIRFRRTLHENLFLFTNKSGNPMNIQQMLSKMCHSDILTESDINAICKSRGFSAREASSRTVVENFFFSKIGVAAALASLSHEEITLLHLLKLELKAVDVSFFERLYGEEKSSSHYSRTFTQHYTPVFKAVQRALVRKGLLVMAAVPDKGSKQAKLERWRFRFPETFEKFLPPWFRQPLVFKGKGTVKPDTLRQKVMGILEYHKKLPSDDRTKYHLDLKQGQLLMGNELFSVNKLLAWQQAYWHDLVLGGAKKAKPKKKDVYFFHDEEAASEPKEFPPLVNDAFAQLAPNQWVSPEALSTLLRFFYDGMTPPSCKSVCEAGWQLGCLAKHAEKGKDYYQLPPIPQPDNSEPSSYLQVTSDGAIMVNMKTIPYEHLVHIAAFSDLQVAAYSLKATPNFIRMGNAQEDVWNHSITVWITENAAAYQQVMTKIAARWGQQIVHENLLLARVKDLSLKVQIQKNFTASASIVLLPNDFIAFPRVFFWDIQKFVNKAGYVVKTVF